ncbi:MAG: RNA methyltransferase [Acidobacteria bacterium]|nr:RNA methyltransferase [Acidobacteriota bacterium]
MLIASRQNRVVKQFLAVRARRAPSLIFLEGWRLVHEALELRYRLKAILYHAARGDRPDQRECLALAAEAGIELYEVNREVMRAVSELETPPGIAAIAERPRTPVERLLGDERYPPLIVAAAGIRDPGNLGTIVRAAESFGATGLLTMTQTADPFSPKVIRASSGSVLRLPIATLDNDAGLRALAKCQNLSLMATSPVKGEAPDRVDFRRRSLLLFGNEATGLSGEMLISADEWVRIPHRPQVKSMNVALAAAVLLYEAARQRGFKL